MATREGIDSRKHLECIAPSLIARIRSGLLDWGRQNFEEFPWRSTDDEWFGLVAEILLQRTRASNVIPVYELFIRTFPSPAALALASVEEIEQVIYPLGLRWRAPLLKELGEQVSRLGQMPSSQAALKELPAIGPYIAAAWMSFHKGQRAVIVDSNVVRWLSRLFGFSYDGETRRKTWMIRLADDLTPQDRIAEYNYAVLDFTMQICKPSRPSCETCPIGSSFCSFGQQQEIRGRKE